MLLLLEMVVKVIKLSLKGGKQNRTKGKILRKLAKKGGER